MRIGGGRKNKGKPAAGPNTLAIQDALRKAGRSQVTIPTGQGVEEAKEWVDDVEK